MARNTCEPQSDRTYRIVTAKAQVVVGAVDDYLNRFRSPTADQQVSTLRNQAMKLLSETALMPTKKSEHWRYTSLHTLLDASGTATAYDTTATTPAVVPANTAILSGASWQIATSGFSAGVTAHNLSAAKLPNRFWTDLAAIQGSGDPFTRLNLAALDDALVLSVPANTSTELPLHLIYDTAGNRLAQHGLVILRLGQGADCTLIEEEAQTLTGYLNARLAIHLEPNAVLRHERRQCAGANGWQLSSLDVRLESGSHYYLTQASLGGVLKRNDVCVHLCGDGATADIQALCLALGTQQTDHHFNILHEAAGGESNTNLRGLAGDSGKVIIDGRILIAEGAGQTSAHLKNPNLMLSTSAEINSKPALEIYAQDVQCSHGSTIGQLDEQAYFFLLSRGIDAATARLMLARGFAAAILNNISDDATRNQWLQPLTAAVTADLVQPDTF